MGQQNIDNTDRGLKQMNIFFNSIKRNNMDSCKYFPKKVTNIFGYLRQGGKKLHKC